MKSVFTYVCRTAPNTSARPLTPGNIPIQGVQNVSTEGPSTSSMTEISVPFTLELMGGRVIQPSLKGYFPAGSVGRSELRPRLATMVGNVDFSSPIIRTNSQDGKACKPYVEYSSHKPDESQEGQNCTRKAGIGDFLLESLKKETLLKSQCLVGKMKTVVWSPEMSVPSERKALEPAKRKRTAREILQRLGEMSIELKSEMGSDGKLTPLSSPSPLSSPASSSSSSSSSSSPSPASSPIMLRSVQNSERDTGEILNGIHMLAAEMKK